MKYELFTFCSFVVEQLVRGLFFPNTLLISKKTAEIKEAGRFEVPTPRCELAESVLAQKMLALVKVTQNTQK